MPRRLPPAAQAAAMAVLFLLCGCSGGSGGGTAAATVLATANAGANPSTQDTAGSASTGSATTTGSTSTTGSTAATATTNTTGWATTSNSTTTPAGTTTSSATTTTTTATSSAIPYLRGVNLAGLDRSVGAYTTPTSAGLTYFHNKGMNGYRLMILWQNTLASLTGGGINGGGRVGADLTTLDPTRMAAYDATIASITNVGDYVIIDPHQGGRFHYYDGGPSTIIGGTGSQGGGPTAAQFAAWWTNIANRYKSNTRVIFEIENEPNGQNMTDLVNTENTVIAAIRATGATNLILADPNNWSGADSWASIGDNTGGVPNATAMLGIFDSGHNLAFDIHQYFDGAGGTLAACITQTVAGAYFGLDAVTIWARGNGKRLFYGEFGTGNNAICNTEVRAMLTYVEAASDVWMGWTAFSAFAGQNTYDGLTYGAERACTTTSCGYWYLLDPTSGPSNYTAPSGEDTRLISGGLFMNFLTPRT